MSRLKVDSTVLIVKGVVFGVANAQTGYGHGV